MSSGSVAIGHAFARARVRRAETALSTAGIASVVCGLVLLLSMPSVAGELVLRHTLNGLDPADRTVTVVVAPEAAQTEAGLRTIDARLRRRFAGSGLAPLRRIVELRALAASDGSVFRLGGVDVFASALRIVEGRVPAPCSATRCEVVAVGAASISAAMQRPTTDIVVVGRAVRRDPVLFTGPLAPEKGEQLLVANGVQGVERLRSIELIRRVHAWVAPIDARHLTRSRVAPLLASLAGAGGDVDIPGYGVTAPDGAITSALERASTSSRRLALPAGELAVMLVATTVVVAFASRRGHREAGARLVRRGADPVVTTYFTLASTGSIVVGGALVGLLLGFAALRIIAAQARVPFGSLIGRSVRPGSVLALAVAVIVIWLLMSSLLRMKEPSRPTRAVRASDLIGVASVAVLALLLGRGTTTSASLARGSDPVLWSIPVLAAITICCAAVRLVPVVIRALARVVPSGRALDRVALADAATTPLRPLMTSAAVAVAVAFATFGIGYRSTLDRGASEQAAFAVPFDVTLSVSSSLVRPTEIRPRAGWGSLASRAGRTTVATDVLRRSASVRRSGADADIVDVLALDPRTLTSMRAWRPDYGPPPARLARALPAPPLRTIGTPLPAGAASIELDVGGRGSTGVNAVQLAVVVERGNGTWHEIEATWTQAERAVAVLESRDRGGRFIGLRVAQPGETAKHQEHRSGEGRTAAEATAITLDVRHVRVVHGTTSTDLPLDASALTSRAATTTARPGGGLVVRVQLQGTSALLVPRVDSRPIPALVDPLTADAAKGGVLTAETQGATFAFRVVGTAARFPTVGDRFIVADVRSLSTRFNLAQPAYGSPNEVWLAADPPTRAAGLAAALQRPPFDLVGVERRAALVDDVRGDPLSRIALAVLLGSALLALLVAAAVVLLGSMGERVDDEAFHRSLLLEGAPPRAVRRLVALRSIGLAAAALPVGLVGGAWLASIVVGVVRLTADGIAAEPGLRQSVPWRTLAFALLVSGALLSGAAVIGARLVRGRVGQELLRGAS